MFKINVDENWREETWEGCENGNERMRFESDGGEIDRLFGGNLYFFLTAKEAKRSGLVRTYEEASDVLDALPRRAGTNLPNTDSYGVWGPTVEDVFVFYGVKFQRDLSKFQEFVTNSWKCLFDHNKHFRGFPRSRKKCLWARPWKSVCGNKHSWDRVSLRIMEGIYKLSPKGRMVAKAIMRRELFRRGEEGTLLTPGNFPWEELQGVLQGGDYDDLLPHIPHGEIWSIEHGRVPQSVAVKRMEREVIVALKGHLRVFLKGLNKIDRENEHEVLALAKLVLVFGNGWEGFVRSTGLSVHDAGIGLPLVASKDQVAFLKRYPHRVGDATKVVSSWGGLLLEGINPLQKGGLDMALKVMASWTYSSVKDKDFALECAKHGIPQSDFEEFQEKWLGHKKTQSSIPGVDILQGGWRFHRLHDNDPKGLFLGEYTGCCQHPGGAGESCAWHGAQDPDGGFVVLENPTGKISLQSWVWRSGDTLIFDNIEGNISNENIPLARGMYIEAARLLVGKLGVTAVLCGTQLSDLTFEQDAVQNPHSINTYSDSCKVWVLAGAI